MTANEIRQKFLDFFEQRGHRVVPSSSLVPWNDPTLLFINAGMNQFKDVFLGLEKRNYNRAVSSQKCVRAGGKHNDLEVVGFTRRHHTFFEMLGNFSFGDYFKKEAIAYAWELITSPDWYGIDKEKLYVTIFEGDKSVPRDDEAYKHWLDQGVDKSRIFEAGAKDNFWQMGETGPCGPCSEIHYDSGPEASDEGHKDCKFPCECGRYVEIWNLVFMQFDRDAKGTLTPLPKPSIDTGAGLERLAAVLQRKISNYDTDILRLLVNFVSDTSGVQYGKESHTDVALRVIADHARAATFLISDGVLPSNEGRGYVLRKIMRRAIDYGRQLEIKDLFLHEIARQVAETMRIPYPELSENIQRIDKVTQQEEEKYARLVAPAVDRMVAAIQSPRSRIDRILNKYRNRVIDAAKSPEETIRQQLNETLGKLREQLLEVATTPGRRVRQHIQEALEEQRQKTLEIARAPSQDLRRRILEIFDHNQRLITEMTSPITGKELFFARDSLGLRPDFVRDLARERGWKIDSEAEIDFEQELAAQRERARASWKGAAKAAASPAYRKIKPTEFEGYAQTASPDCEVLAIVRDGSGVPDLKPGEEGEVVLDHTPFYAESGGQVGDVGWFYDAGRNAVIADVDGCVSPVQGVQAHRVKARQPLLVGDKLEAVVNHEVREETMRNHTATHLLHSALRATLGEHVKQAGSLVDPEHLRFDFSHFTDVADEELQDIEDLINRQVLDNTIVETFPDVPIDEAVNKYKAMALFGEKYGDRVRVIRIGDFSTELCGGTHVAHTGEIGLVKILTESSVAAGVRRVQAISGSTSLRQFQQRQKQARDLARVLQVGEEKLVETAERLSQQAREAGKQLVSARTRLALQNVEGLLEKADKVGEMPVVAAVVKDVEREALRSLVDTLRQRVGSGVVVLGTALEGKAALIVGVTKDLTTKLHAGKIIKEVAREVGGGGGGRADLAEAGGRNPERLGDAIRQVPEIIEKML